VFRLVCDLWRAIVDVEHMCENAAILTGAGWRSLKLEVALVVPKVLLASVHAIDRPARVVHCAEEDCIARRESKRVNMPRVPGHKLLADVSVMYLCPRVT
jgi:hypothetical protein